MQHFGEDLEQLELSYVSTENTNGTITLETVEQIFIELTLT